MSSAFIILLNGILALENLQNDFLWRERLSFSLAFDIQKTSDGFSSFRRPLEAFLFFFFFFWRPLNAFCLVLMLSSVNQNRLYKLQSFHPEEILHKKFYPQKGFSRYFMRKRPLEGFICMCSLYITLHWAFRKSSRHGWSVKSSIHCSTWKGFFSMEGL